MNGSGPSYWPRWENERRSHDQHREEDEMTEPDAPARVEPKADLLRDAQQQLKKIRGPALQDSSRAAGSAHHALPIVTRAKNLSIKVIFQFVTGASR
jgi:hypothetical protein